MLAPSQLLTVGNTTLTREQFSGVSNSLIEKIKIHFPNGKAKKIKFKCFNYAMKNEFCSGIKTSEGIITSKAQAIEAKCENLKRSSGKP